MPLDHPSDEPHRHQIGDALRRNRNPRVRCERSRISPCHAGYGIRNQQGKAVGHEQRNKQHHDDGNEFSATPDWEIFGLRGAVLALGRNFYRRAGVIARLRLHRRPTGFIGKVIGNGHGDIVPGKTASSEPGWRGNGRSTEE